MGGAEALAACLSAAVVAAAGVAEEVVGEGLVESGEEFEAIVSVARCLEDHPEAGTETAVECCGGDC